MSEIKVGDTVVVTDFSFCYQCDKNGMNVDRGEVSKRRGVEPFTVISTGCVLPAIHPFRDTMDNINNVILKSNLDGRLLFTQACYVELEKEPNVIQDYADAVTRAYEETARNTLAAFEAATEPSSSEATPAPADISDKMLREIVTESDHDTRVRRVEELHTFVNATELL